jgi:hypothetical protein
VLTSSKQHDIINISNNKREVKNMTKVTYIWTNGNTYRVFKSHAEVMTQIRDVGGTFTTHYTEGKDVDYCAPNPNTKRFKNRLVIA